MESEGSSPCSQERTTCSCPEADQSSSHPHPISLRFILIFSEQCLGFPSCFFPSGFPTNILFAPLLYPIHATSHSSLLIAQIFGEEQKS